MKTNILKNLKTPYVEKNDVKIESILEMIREGTFKEKVLKARNYGKSDPTYENIKSSMPTFTPNASFYNRRNSENIKALTGLIYLDVDQNIDVDKLKKFSFVYSFWKSLSAEGYGILVKVNNLTSSNFTNTWCHLYNLFKEHGINIDVITKDITRQNVISYDPNIYINQSCIPIDTNDIKTDYINNNTSLSGSTIKETYTCNTTNTNNNIDFNEDYLHQINYVTKLNNYFDQDYIIIENGKEYRNAYVPREIPDGRRHTTLKNYIKGILFNTPDIKYNDLKKLLFKVNHQHCSPSLSKKELLNLLNWLYNKFQDNHLTIQTGKKKIWINPYKGFSTKEKKQLIGRLVGQIKRDNTIKELKEEYNRLKKENNKVTQKMLSEKCNKSIRTIKRYWKEIIN